MVLDTIFIKIIDKKFVLRSLKTPKQTQVKFTQHHLSGVIWETKYRLVRIVAVISYMDTRCFLTSTQNDSFISFLLHFFSPNENHFAFQSWIELEWLLVAWKKPNREEEEKNYLQAHFFYFNQKLNDLVVT